MKRLFLSLSMMIAVSVANAQQTQPTTYIRNSCHSSFNFLGIVEIWSGSIDTHQIVNGVDTIINSTECGKGGGSWDWFWE